MTVGITQYCPVIGLGPGFGFGLGLGLGPGFGFGPGFGLGLGLGAGAGISNLPTCTPFLYTFMWPLLQGTDTVPTVPGRTPPISSKPIVGF